MRVPRTTVIRRLDQLQRRSLIDRQAAVATTYKEKTAQFPYPGMRSYRPKSNNFLSEATQELTHFGHFAGLTASV